MPRRTRCAPQHLAALYLASPTHLVPTPLVNPQVFGWVLEMWGYTLAATRLGIRHTVWKEFQAEPSSQWHTELEGDPHIYHYTFGLEYTLDG